MDAIAPRTKKKQTLRDLSLADLIALRGYAKAERDVWSNIIDTPSEGADKEYEQKVYSYWNWIAEDGTEEEILKRVGNIYGDI